MEVKISASSFEFFCLVDLSFLGTWSHNTCCHTKEVGGVTYHHIDDHDLVLPDACLSHCVYRKHGEEGKHCLESVARLEVILRMSWNAEQFNFGKPIKDIYKFVGQCESQELELKQFMPRGSFIKNSAGVYCMVAYTGVDTKLVLNQGEY